LSIVVCAITTPYNSLLALVSGLSDVKLSEDDIGDGDDI